MARLIVEIRKNDIVENDMLRLNSVFFKAFSSFIPNQKDYKYPKTTDGYKLPRLKVSREKDNAF